MGKIQDEINGPRGWLRCAREPLLREIGGTLIRMLRPRSNPLVLELLDDIGAAAVISLDPLVVYTAAGLENPIGMAGGLRPQLAGIPATFLIAIHGSIERHRKAYRIRRAALVHRFRHPEHRFIALCNTPKEQMLLADLGEPAIFMNHNIFIGTDVFFPIDGTEIKYDAVYNARLSPQKRHYLSLKIDTCAMIFSSTRLEDPTFEKRLINRHSIEAPGHTFVNEIGPDGPIMLTPAQVNQIYNQAHVGLCLSQVEGAMNSSMEYLLAGLPIVSTYSWGGREVYFDRDYCIETGPDPDAIRKAVLDLKARRIPRSYVRQQTLAKIKLDRQRFLDLLSDLSVNIQGDTEANWPFPNKLVTWRKWREFLPDIFVNS